MVEPNQPRAEPAPMADDRLAELRAIVDAQPEGATAAWRRSQAMAAERRPQDARERRDEARATLNSDRQERRSLRRRLRLAKPGEAKEAARARLDEIEQRIARDRSELRKAELVAGRYEHPQRSRHETSAAVRPKARSHATYRRRLLPRRTPTARVAARRPGCRRTARTASRGDPSCSTEGDDDPAGRVARLTFPHFHRLTAGLSGAVRLERFEALSPGAQDACWRDLARELEEARS